MRLVCLDFLCSADSEFPDCSDCSFEFGEDFASLNAQDLDSAGLHPFVAGFVVEELVGLVGLAVDFDNEAGIAAIEICYVGAEWMLGTEGETGDLVVSER